MTSIFFIIIGVSFLLISLVIIVGIALMDKSSLTFVKEENIDKIYDFNQLKLYKTQDKPKSKRK